MAARPICGILFLYGFLTQTIQSRTVGRPPPSGRKGAASLRRVDFENGGIVQNILQSAFPMLIAQILNLLYNIVDRVYIARIPEIGTAALGAVARQW